MAGTLAIEICAPAFRPVWHEGESVILPGQAGVLTVLPGHTPLLTTLAPGVLVVHETGKKTVFYAVQGGFAEIRENHVRILPLEVEPGEIINRHAAQADLERAIGTMRKPEAHGDIASAERAAVMARARLQAVDRQEF